MLDAVGRVNRDGGGFCTGTLIAPDQVLTAAHCLWDAASATLLRRAVCTSWPAGVAAATRAMPWPCRSTLAPDLRLDADGAPADPLTDWAVLTLERPLGRPGLRPMPFAGAADRARGGQGAALARIGYGRDRPHLPVLVEPCRLLGVGAGGRLLLHDCDATYGDSGSPILMRTGDGYAMVAMETAMLRAAGDVVGAALVLGTQRDLPAAALVREDLTP